MTTRQAIEKLRQLRQGCDESTGDALDMAMYWAGIAAYAHLSSAGSEQWKKQHGFKTGE